MFKLKKYSKQYNKKYIVAFLSFAIVWSFGFSKAYKSWDSVVYNNPKQPKRHLASISSQLDLSNVSAIYPDVFDEQNVLNKAYVIETKNATQIYLGHISASSSFIKLVCSNYSHLKLTLRSADININGEALTMTLTSLCNVSKNIRFIDPINIPVSKIKKNEITDFKNKKITLKNAYFLQMSSEWLVTKISFFSKTGSFTEKFSVVAANPFAISLR